MICYPNRDDGGAGNIDIVHSEEMSHGGTGYSRDYCNIDIWWEIGDPLPVRTESPNSEFTHCLEQRLIQRGNVCDVLFIPARVAVLWLEVL